MHAAVLPGERVGLRSRRSRPPVLGGGFWLCALLWCIPAHAGSLYHCVGHSGEAVFSSTRVGYHDCRIISHYVPRPASRRPAPVRVSLARASGSVIAPATTAVAKRRWRPPASLTWVHGAVESATASAPALARADVKRGLWSYRQSSTSAAPAAVAGDGDRVLRGAVYRVTRADGSVEYTNVQPAHGAGRVLFSYIATCVACSLHSSIHWNSVALHLDAYADAIHAASTEYGVDEAFLRAIIHAESAFNPNALSLKGAQGLMQLMPDTANDMGVLNAFDASQNIRGGARYLGLLLHDFNGNERLAAAAYNAGPAAVQRYSGVPPYAETRVYVQRVGTLLKRYAAALHPPLAALGSLR